MMLLLLRVQKPAARLLFLPLLVFWRADADWPPEEKRSAASVANCILIVYCVILHLGDLGEGVLQFVLLFCLWSMNIRWWSKRKRDKFGPEAKRVQIQKGRNEAGRWRETPFISKTRKGNRQMRVAHERVARSAKFSSDFFFWPRIKFAYAAFDGLCFRCRCR